MAAISAGSIIMLGEEFVQRRLYFLFKLLKQANCISLDPQSLWHSVESSDLNCTVFELSHLLQYVHQTVYLQSGLINTM